MIRLATVGSSSITEQFIAACGYEKRIELAAVYSRDEKRGRAFADKFGIKEVFCDLEALSRWEGIDAVYIASPNSCHAEQSRLFLLGGKHVICEKPVVTNAAEYRELKALADSKGLIYMEAVTSWHNEGRLKALSAIEDIGNIAAARIDYSQRSSRYDSFLAGEHQNIFDMSLHAGTLMDLGVYCVYGAVELFGEPQNIEANASFLKNGADGSGCAIFDYGSFQAVLTYSKTGQSAIGTEIIGDRGTLKIGLISQFSDISVVTPSGENVLTQKPSRPELMSGEAIAFADFTEGKRLEDYNAVSAQTEIVHRCMDIIKQKAKIIYK